MKKMTVILSITACVSLFGESLWDNTKEQVRVGVTTKIENIADTLSASMPAGLFDANIGMSDILNMNIGSLASSLSFECGLDVDITEIPKGICGDSEDELFGDADKINKYIDQWNKEFNFSLFGKANCSVKPSAQITNNFTDLLKANCEAILAPARKVWSQSNIDSIRFADSATMRTNFSTSGMDGTILYDGSNPKLKGKKYSLADPTMPNGLKQSGIYNNVNGVFSFDKIVKNNSNKTPTKLRDAYIRDDYATYSAYERCAKTFSPTSGKNGVKEIDFRDCLPSVPETYQEYMIERDLAVKESASKYVSMYSLEQKLEQELIRIRKDKKIEGKTSADMKASYLEIQQSVLKELFEPKVKQKDEEDIADTTELAKALRNIENHELKKFTEEEDKKKSKGGYIVAPSQQKVNTRITEDRVAYASRILNQQTEEIRVMTEAKINIEKKKDLMKLLAKKTYYQTLQYDPSIAKKELSELFGEK